MHCAGLAYNILRAVGQVGLMSGKQRRRARQRRRLKTVIQNLAYFAGRFIRHAHTLTLRFSRHAHDQYDAFSRSYRGFRLWLIGTEATRARNNPTFRMGPLTLKQAQRGRTM
jgi:hypothetical protein